MQPWSSWQDQKAAIERSAARAGCKVFSIAPKETSVGTYVQARLGCSDPWDAASLLALISEEDARTAGARDFALALRADGGATDADFVRQVFELGRRIRFVKEPGEVFASPSYTLSVNQGDCDDHARAMYAILRAGGVPARIVFLHRGLGGEPTHAVTQAYAEGAWTWLETTLPANLGESPFQAARRLGMLKNRTDIADRASTIDLRTMGRNMMSIAIGFIAAAVVANPASSYTPTEIATFEKKGYTQDLSPAFFVGVVNMAARMRTLGADVTGEDLLAVWNGESGIGASVGGKNPDGSIDRGLNQLHDLSFVGWKDTPEAYLALSAEQQLPWVERYYMKSVRPAKNWQHIAGARGLYAINGWPGPIAMGVDPRDDGAILGVRGKSGYYSSFDDQGLGVNFPDQIDRWILKQQLGSGKRWIEARARYWLESGDQPARLSVARTVGVALGAVALVVGGVYFARES